MNDSINNIVGVSKEASSEEQESNTVSLEKITCDLCGKSFSKQGFPTHFKACSKKQAAKVVEEPPKEVVKPPKEVVKPPINDKKTPKKTTKKKPSTKSSAASSCEVVEKDPIEVVQRKKNKTIFDMIGDLFN